MSVVGGQDGAQQAPAATLAEGEAAILRAVAAAEPVTEDGTPVELWLARKMRNDLGNAERLIARHGHDLHYVQDIGWYAWTGNVWSYRDGRTAPKAMAQRTVKAIAGEARALLDAGPLTDDSDVPSETEKEFLDRVEAHRKFATTSGNTARLNGMIEEARVHLTVEPSALDAHHRLLTVANGTLRLADEAEGGIVLGPSDRRNLITRSMRAAFDPEAECPRFRRFLEEILPDAAVRVFIQVWLGYTITGETSEQALLMATGTGSNGKSTLIDVIADVMGDYAMTLPFSSLLQDERRRGQEATPDLARLPGARMVSAVEPDTGARFDSGRIKQLTGQDKLTVRHLNRDFFDYEPCFKLILSFNQKPKILALDNGMWRRLLLVPFTRQFDASRVDRFLRDKLKAESSGILNWMLDGLRIWLERGLEVPEAVRAATQAYREESDPIGPFLDVGTRRADKAITTSAALYKSYLGWCKLNAVEPISQTRFGKLMVERGYERSKAGTMYYHDIEITTAFDQHARHDPGPSSEDDYA